jgi:hypothetical protein
LTIPDYLFDYDECLIGMSYTGKSIKDNIDNGYNPYLAGYKVGVLLKFLHTYSSSVNCNDILNNRKIKNIIASGLIKDQSLIDNYLNNPGNFGYCHGDASVNNFTILNDNIVMIDFSGLSKMGPYGIPAYEYYQFLTSIESNFISQNIVDKLTMGFKDGYGNTGFTQETDILFKTYWYTKFYY